MDAMKAEKRRAMLRYRRLRLAATLSRCLLEALAALFLLSWSSARLPAALSLCAGLRQLPALLLHPLSAFLLGNAIIVTLVAKSSEATVASDYSQLPLPTSSSAASGAHDHRRHCSYVSASLPRHFHRGEDGAEVVFEDKAVCAEGATTATAVSAASYYTTSSPTDERTQGPRFQRTRSVDVAGSVANRGAEDKLLLRRSQSVIGAGAAATKIVAKWWAEEKEEEMVEEDDNEEFRRRIEAFIAKQLRFIEREEESLLLAAKAPAGAGAGALKVAGGGQDGICR